MPKRPNPFGDGSPLQFKLHIGTKELDLNSNENMKKVYERTQQLLYEGANKVKAIQHQNGNEGLINVFHANGYNTVLNSQDNMCINGHNNGKYSYENCHTETHGLMANGSSFHPKALVLPGQMQFNESGQISGFYTKKMVNGISSKLSPSTCSTCSHQMTSPNIKCHFCDKTVCSSCIRQCCNCGGEFCHLCSLMNYDECLERPFCLSCAAS